MATYLSTIKFTEQGIRNIRETCQRAQSVKAAAEKLGIRITDIYWTLGPQDGVIVMEAPDEETATALMLQVGSLGNVQTQTTRAFKAAEMEKILAKMAG